MTIVFCAISMYCTSCAAVPGQHNIYHVLLQDDQLSNHSTGVPLDASIFVSIDLTQLLEHSIHLTSMPVSFAAGGSTVCTDNAIRGRQTQAVVTKGKKGWLRRQLCCLCPATKD